VIEYLHIGDIMKVMTIGAGFVSEHLPYQTLDTRIDFSSKAIDNMLEVNKPDVLINCIGKTGRPNVDWVEVNREISASTNTALPILLAEACAKKSIHLIQLGSGCIFFGKSPHEEIYDIDEGNVSLGVIINDTGWREDDFANPVSFYSRTKYACDLILDHLSNVTTLRIRMPISTRNHHRNLINKLRGYKQVIDIPNSMTFMGDLTRCVDWIIKGSHMGTFHVTNPEPLSPADFMREYQKYVPSHSFEIINEKQLDKIMLAKRSNCIINSDKLKNAGFTMTPSREALTDYMAQYVKNI
jgi:3,5-epimerase/4-reductase